jgi:hypothetical protein
MQKFSEEIAAEERRLDERAAALRAQQTASPQAKVEQLEKFLAEVEGIHRNALESAQFTWKHVDADGNIKKGVGNGIPTGYPPNSLVVANFKSKKRLAAAAVSVMTELKLLLQMIERGKSPPPADVEAYIAGLRARIPEDTGEMEIIAKPKE